MQINIVRRDCAVSAFLQTCDTKTNKHRRVQVTEVTGAASCILNHDVLLTILIPRNNSLTLTSYDNSVTYENTVWKFAPCILQNDN